ncbi:MAG: hypothetical protein KJ579_07640, partial [Verrucomicrobia bacterium]|nr:hypothetical protein [Verrucomicrobiota bacterium]
PRLPDTRREWDVSFYCGWDPVLRTGKGYPHRPPDSLTVAALYFGRTIDALKAGNLADAARIAGAMFHYIQDSGSFPHMQPIHRAFHTQKTDGIHIEGYTPRRLGSSPAEAATALVERVSGLVASSERRLAPLLAEAGVPLEEARALCARELVPDVVRRAVAKLREGKPADYEAAAIDCANECARVCADAIYTALALAPHPLPPSTPSRPGTNLVFNPSFETDDGDGTPDGWYVGWLDLADRSGRAEWYRAGTHWDKPVKTGGRSAMILWAPPKGLEWRQSWRRATPVEAGAVYRGTASVLTRAATGATWLALQFFDTAYLPMVDAKSEIVKADTGWRELSVDTPAPPGACWLRAVLHTEANDGAVWFDDIGIVKLAR